MANEFKIKKGLIVTGASGGTVVDIQGSQGQNDGPIRQSAFDAAHAQIGDPARGGGHFGRGQFQDRLSGAAF